MSDIQRQLANAALTLEDALEAATIPAAIDALALALVQIEEAGRIEARADILRGYFAANPGVNAQRAAAPRQGKGFVFEMPADVRKQLDEVDGGQP
jgi:hypothetical protein